MNDLMVEGFHKLDDSLLETRAPKISWLSGYKNLEAERKVRYLEKLAATMNHAAKLAQDQRNELTRLMVLKEKQLEVLAKQMEANNHMLQSEVTRMNEQRQEYHANVSDLNARIRELERGHSD